VTDVVNAATTESVIWLLYERAAEVGGRRTGQLTTWSIAVGLLAVLDLVVATFGHVVGLLHESVDGIVDSLDSVGVVDRKFRVVRSLNLLIDDTVDYAESVHLKLDTFDGAVLDTLVLLVEVVVKPWSIVTAITIS
jgi:hypothetical protein